MSKSVILKGTLILAIFYVVSKFLSFVVEVLIATNLGACNETDIYYLIDSIINSILPMLTVGIWKVFLPEYKGLVVQNKKNDAARLTYSLLIVFTFLSLLISLSLFFFPNFFVSIYAPGFNLSMREQTASLVRIISPVFVFATLSTFPTAIFQSKSNFVKSQAKEILYFLFPIVVLLVFSTDVTVDVLIYSVLLAYVAACIMQFSLLDCRNTIKFDIKVLNKNTLSILRLFPVASLNSIILQLNNVIDKIFSSTLVVGSITCLNYGSKVIHLFDGLFSTAVSVAVFPRLTELYSTGDKLKLNSFFYKYIVCIGFILFPISLLLLLFANDIVTLLFGYGKFSVESIQTTSLVLQMYALGFVAMGLTTIFNDIFFIMKKLEVLLYTTMLNICCNVLFDLLFVDEYGVPGLCLATTISLYITLIIKWCLLSKHIKMDIYILYNFIHILISLLISFILYKYILSCFFVSYNLIFRLLFESLSIILIYIFSLASLNKTCRCIILGFLWKKKK